MFVGGNPGDYFGSFEQQRASHLSRQMEGATVGCGSFKLLLNKLVGNSER